MGQSKYVHDKTWFLFMCLLLISFSGFPIFAADLTPSPSEEVDIQPSLTFTTSIPSTIKQKEVDFKGVATGAYGIQEIRITVDNLGIAVVSTFKMRESPQESFWITVPFDFGENVITFEAVDTTGQIGKKEFTIVRPRPATPTPHSPTPVPTLRVQTVPTPTPSPTPTSRPATRAPLAPTPTPSRIVQLLKLADQYFDQQWFLTPKDTNAFDVYAEVLRLEPSNRYARKRLETMLQTYYNWGTKNFTQGNYEKTKTYYQRYLVLAEFLIFELGEEQLTEKVQDVQRKLAQIDVTLAALRNTPTPLPLTVVPTVTSLPTQPPTPRPTVAPLPTRSPIPLPVVMPTPTQQPIPESGQPPVILLTSTIPAETSQTTLEITGTATDDDGVTDVIVSSRRPNSKGLVLTSVSEGSIQEGSFHFQEVVQLHPGTNEILIEARDTKGQVSQKTFQIVRHVTASEAVSSEREDTEDPRSGDVYAVIIGIETYKDESLNRRFTENDARGLYDLLRDPDYGRVPEDHIRLLLNEDATDREIKGAIGKWLRRRAKEEDTVLIYYSGHGAPEGDETYWVTYDADINDLYTTALGNNDIADMLSRIRAKRVITLLDSSYSEAIVNRKDRTRSAPTEIPWEKFSGEGRVTISASDGKQESLELEEYQHGVFTYYLLEGLRGEADADGDGVIELDEIWDYIEYQISEAAQQKGKSQTPVFQGAHSAGIPLTYNMPYLRELQQQQAVEAKQHKLAELYAQDLIKDTHFICALGMLDAGTSNIWLDKLLEDKISPEIFTRFFKCETQ